MNRYRYVFVLIAICMSLVGCAKQENNPITGSVVTEDASDSIESSLQEVETETEPDEANAETQCPTKDEVLAMRQKVLEGMSEEEIDRLRENIKIANLAMERAYLNDNIFERLSDKDSPYWLYFDQKGEIQLGWWYKQAIFSKEAIMKAENISEEEFAEKFTEPGMVYNRFDADNFIALISDMQSTVQNEELRADLQQLIDLTSMAKETHEMEYANEIYKILHDMDYFLLRYGIEDVGKYTKDAGTVAKYYGVLTVYE